MHARGAQPKRVLTGSKNSVDWEAGKNWMTFFDSVHNEQEGRLIIPVISNVIIILVLFFQGRCSNPPYSIP